MPERRPFEGQLSLKAAEFVYAQPKGRQRIILDLADQIAKHPFRISDYQLTDSLGRKIDNLRLEGYLFSYWVDQSSCEVLVTEIIRL